MLDVFFENKGDLNQWHVQLVDEVHRSLGQGDEAVNALVVHVVSLTVSLGHRCTAIRTNSTAPVSSRPATPWVGAVRADFDRDRGSKEEAGWV